jgi:hypothetical protein
VIHKPSEFSQKQLAYAGDPAVIIDGYKGGGDKSFQFIVAFISWMWRDYFSETNDQNQDI